MWENEPILLGLAVLLIAIAAVSIIPLPMPNGRRHWQLLLPWYSIGIWLIYELTTWIQYRKDIPIRLDLAFIIPIVAIPIIARLVRSFILRRREESVIEAERSRSKIELVREKIN